MTRRLIGKTLICSFALVLSHSWAAPSASAKSSSSPQETPLVAAQANKDTVNNAAAGTLRFSVIKTGSVEQPEALVIPGGSLTKSIALNHSGFLIQNGDKYILFETGLGSQIDAQFKQDMPFYLKPFFSYTKGKPVSAQLPMPLQYKIGKIYLSHVHWDHASGLSDFPSGCIAVSEAERQELEGPKKGGTFPSQFAFPGVRWCTYVWSDKDYMGFKKSFDIFGDESAVLVHLPGHTEGSAGLFLKTKAKTYFLVGDLVWNLRALNESKPRPWISSILVDRDRTQVAATLEAVKQLKAKHPDLVIVPTHDAEIQDQLGYFPNWVE